MCFGLFTSLPPLRVPSAPSSLFTLYLSPHPTSPLLLVFFHIHFLLFFLQLPRERTLFTFPFSLSVSTNQLPLLPLTFCFRHIHFDYFRVSSSLWCLVLHYRTLVSARVCYRIRQDSSDSGFGAIRKPPGGEMEEAFKVLELEDKRHNNTKELLAAEFGLQHFANKWNWRRKQS